MKRSRTILVLTLALGFFSRIGPAQTLDPTLLVKSLSDSWPTYSGDYSGKRYSTLTQLNQSNVKNLTLAWTGRLSGGPANLGTVQTIIGGEGAGEYAGVTIKGAILQVSGTLYVSSPDNAWAVDGRDGHVIWHYFWRTRGGTHIGNRGLGMWRDRLFMETPDNYLVSLDSKTGKELWHVEISDFDLQYFSTMAPIVVGDHVLVGTGNDLDEPGMLQSFDPETGKRQWVWYSVPMKAGDPGLSTWKNLDASRHGGGQVWVPGAYDPETHLYITGTGNPSPAYTSASRGEGENLYTCSIVAINVDTGKMAWYYQTSPHDTHDWDTTETPILVDAELNGRMRKLALHASRNGYYFTLDRTTGERLVSTKYSDTANWAKGISRTGQPIRDAEKDFHIGGSLVSPNNTGVTNWPPPSFSPDTGFFYVPRYDSYAMYYLTETDPRGAMGLGGKEEVNVASLGSHLVAIDYKTGKIAWSHLYPSSAGGTMSGILTTAGKLLFAGDNAGNLIAFDPANGKILWHSRIGQVSNAPETYMLDGHQYILAAAGDTLFAFTLY
jgi:alcohol dehydrogenase (cytochrome c)